MAQIECPNCHSKFNLEEKGKFKCPNCNKHFEYDPTVVGGLSASPSISPEKSALEKLKELKVMKEEGLITEDEFEIQKYKVLAGDQEPRNSNNNVAQNTVTVVQNNSGNGCLKVLAILILIPVGIFTWYVSIPAVIAWALWKTNMSDGNKVFFSALVFIVWYAFLGYVYLNSGQYK